ncbi:hypothetical protein [Rubritalea tangerina]|uniref:hypothetical protein n=1 Tax=Rubritalea tangerina TaxID=430798 RepID=UPI003612E5EE
MFHVNGWFMVCGILSADTLVHAPGSGIINNNVEFFECLWGGTKTAQLSVTGQW